MEYLTVPDLQKWQHYKDRQPPWMKLHRDLLRNYDFSLYTDCQKYHLIAIWLLASQCDNRIPYDEEWIAHQIQAEAPVKVQIFIDRGALVQVDSTMLAEWYQDDIGETETEAETETETIREIPPRNSTPYQGIVNLFHEVLPMLPRTEKLTKARKGYLNQRWHEDLTTLEHWRNYFDYVAQSDFLTGRTQSKDGRPPFRASLEWLTRPGNYAKVAEGKYHV